MNRSVKVYHLAAGFRHPPGRLADEFAGAVPDPARLRIRHRGQTIHEFVRGTKRELDQHAALMMTVPDLEQDEPCMAHLAPVRTGEIVWTFNRAGEFDFACLTAGHHQAGTVGTIDVAPATHRSE